MNKQELLELIRELIENEIKDEAEIKNDLPEFAGYLRGKRAAHEHCTEMIEKYL